MKSRNDLRAAPPRAKRLPFPAPTLLLLFAAACGQVTSLQDSSDRDASFIRRLLGTEGQPTAFERPPEEEVLVCPPVEVLKETAYYELYVPKQSPEAKNLRYQAVFSKTARECDFRSDYVAIKYGFAGRVIVGPAGGPGQVTLPLRVEFAGKGDKVIWSRQIKIPVTIPPGVGSQLYTHVGDDLVYQLRYGEKLDDFRIYVGFDKEDGGTRPLAGAR